MLRTRPSQEPLVIHFHGGLVDLAHGIAIAERLLPTYQAAPAYPLFVVWRCGVLETLQKNWPDLVTKNLFGLLRDRALQFVVGWLRTDEGTKPFGVEAPPLSEVRKEVNAKTEAGEEPFAKEFGDNPIVNDRLENDPLAENHQKQIKGLVEGDDRYGKASRELDDSALETLGEDLRRDVGSARVVGESGEGEKAIFTSATLALAVGRVALRTIRRLARGRGHGVYTTVIEETAREIKGDVLGGGGLDGDEERHCRCVRRTG